jgi:hypothetical protein
VPLDHRQGVLKERGDEHVIVTPSAASTAAAAAAACNLCSQRLKYRLVHQHREVPGRVERVLH